ncbi:PH domain-containing protein [Nocardioides panacis]|uniref:PH domain-containing protein n=1 Tax=Nocardioides panacis TaxID=2849501 RepID=A0A975SXG2_9ACTN|nr:PH domain-containing protein [Nocardioides panacis]QWZ07230.1 PH domain-containing protein [Nocardioides panacis]
MSEPERPYKRLSPLTPLVRSFLLVVAVAASTWDDLLRGDAGPIAWLLLGLLVAGAVYGAASWLRTKYWIEADELRVDTGVVSRQSRRIRVDRLQGIDISQPFVARIFGLAELKMDVAGGGAREGSLAFLPLREAQDLRTALLARRDAVRAGETDRAEPAAATDESVGSGPVVGAVAPPDRVLVSLDPAMLVVSLLLSAEFGAFLVSTLVFAGLFVFFGQIVGGLAAAVPLLGGLAVTLFRKLSAYYRLTVSETPAGLQVRRGLFELDAQTIAVSRVQGVVVTEPLLWRRLGWAKVDVSLAGYTSGDRDGKPSTSTVMPVAPRATALWLARRLLEEAGSPDPDAVPLTGPPQRARWVAPVRRRFQPSGLGEHLLVSREGVLGRRTHVVPYARVQSLQVHQGPWQRRFDLADLRVDSPPGPVRVRLRHRDAGEARRLLDRANESARRARSGQLPGSV